MNEAKRDCTRVTECGKDAWSINCGPMDRNRIEGGAGVDGKTIAETAETLKTHWPGIREAPSDGTKHRLGVFCMFTMSNVKWPDAI
jgi:hypothetical protein